MKQANAPGNVLLDVGEANLPKQSVVVVSKVSAVDKTQLGEQIGSLLTFINKTYSETGQVKLTSRD